MTDVAHELTRQVPDRSEDPASDDLAFDAAEPEFDLIEPRGIGRRKMQVQLGMIGQELCDPPGLMGREVVGDDVDLATPGLQRNNLAQESHKLLGGMAGSSLTKDLAAFGVERGVERERAMPIVLKAVALSSPRAKRQHRVEAIEGLNRGLLIDTEYRGVLRRIDVEPDHIGGLALEVWIIRGHVAFQPMRLKPSAPPDPRDHHMIDPQRPRQLAAAPVSGAIIGRAPGPGQDARFQPRSALTHRPPLMAGKQARQTLVSKTVLPTRDVSRTTAQGLLDGGP